MNRFSDDSFAQKKPLDDNPHWDFFQRYSNEEFVQNDLLDK